MKKYALIGKSLGHSFSKAFFEEYFSVHQIDSEYTNIELSTIEEIRAVLDRKIHAGFNVTIPYKEEVIPFLDELDQTAEAVGAVNVVALNQGKWIGYNTDAFGFHQSIKPFLTNLHEKALILGTGGAAKAVSHVFQSIGIDVIYCSRNPQKENEFSYDLLNDYMINACKVIVNTTPVGTYPDIDRCIPFPFQALTPEHLIIDLIYNPEHTKFLREAKLAGATTLNGLSMLREQAMKSWEIWENCN